MPQGFNDLTNFTPNSRQPLGLGDDGTFSYSVITPFGEGECLEDHWFLYRGSAAGESVLGPALTYQPLPPDTNPLSAAPRMLRFYNTSVTVDGRPFGQAQVVRPDGIGGPCLSGIWSASDLYKDQFLGGVYWGSETAQVPGVGFLPPCSEDQFATSDMKIIAASVNGTMVTGQGDTCPAVGAQSAWTLGVCWPGGSRVIAYSNGNPSPGRGSSADQFNLPL